MSDWLKLQDIIEQYRGKSGTLILYVDTRDLHCAVEHEEGVECSYPNHINDVLEVLYSSGKTWWWYKNSKFKYVKLTINLSSKMCNICDRHGVSASLPNLQHQCN